MSPQNLAGITKTKTKLGGNVNRWDENVDMEFKGVRF
jgi:hypothetical protein